MDQSPKQKYIQLHKELQNLYKEKVEPNPVQARNNEELKRTVHGIKSDMFELALDALKDNTEGLPDIRELENPRFPFDPQSPPENRL